MSAVGLPPGLAITSGNVISGTPTTLTIPAKTVRLTANNGDARTSGSLTIQVLDEVSDSTGAPVFSTSGILAASGTVGSPFNYTLKATGAKSFFATGLPAGLAIDSTTGIISGTARVRGTTNVTIKASNGSANTSSKTLRLTMTLPPPKLNVDEDTVLTGTAGVTRGVGFSYKVSNESLTRSTATGLPPGLSIRSNTQIIGNPRVSGTYSVLYTGRNEDASTSVTFTIVIKPVVPVITSSPVATGTQGQSFSYTITGKPNVTSYSVLSSLPAGLTFDETTGVISGTPTGFGVSRITIGASNGTDSRPSDLTLTIKSIGSITVGKATVGSVWSQIPLTLKAGIAGSLNVDYRLSGGGNTGNNKGNDKGNPNPPSWKATLPYGVSLSGTLINVTLNSLTPNSSYVFTVTTQNKDIDTTKVSGTFRTTRFGDIDGDGLTEIPFITRVGLSTGEYNPNIEETNTFVTNSTPLLLNTGFSQGTLRWLGVTDSQPGSGKQTWYHGLKSPLDATPTVFSASYSPDSNQQVVIPASSPNITLGDNTDVLGVVDLGYTGAATLLLSNTSTRTISVSAAPKEDAVIQATAVGAATVSDRNTAPTNPVASFVLPSGYLYGGSGDLNVDGKADLVFYKPSDSTATNTLVVTTNGTAFTSFIVTGPKLEKGYSIIGVDDYISSIAANWLLYNATTGDVNATWGINLTKGTATVRDKETLGITLPDPFYPATSSTGVLTFPTPTPE